MRLLRSMFRFVILAYAVAIAGLAWAAKDMTIRLLSEEPLLVGYAIALGTYLAVRLVGAHLHRDVSDLNYRPAVSVVIPARNNEDGILETLESCLAADYPEHLLEVIVVNDGSTDGTWGRILEAKGRWPKVFALDLGRHYGKRRAMAEGVRRAGGQVLLFVDSDSTLEPSTIKAIVQPFVDGRVGAVVGNAVVRNGDANWITTMQQIWSFPAFRAVRGVQSALSGTVTSASGCYAYRTSMILPCLDAWELQTFLGRPVSFGDDRALTNCVLGGHRVVYQSSARARTVVPTKLRGFVRQQLRWKKSWLRESLSVLRRIWRKNPVAALFTGASIAFPLMAPFVVFESLAGRVTEDDLSAVWFYLVGTYAMALVYSLLCAFRRGDGRWHHAMISVPVYLCFLVFQTYWAIGALCVPSRWAKASRVNRRPIDHALMTALSPEGDLVPVAGEVRRLMGVAG